MSETDVIRYFRRSFGGFVCVGDVHCCMCKREGRGAGNGGNEKEGAKGDGVVCGPWVCWTVCLKGGVMWYGLRHASGEMGRC